MKDHEIVNLFWERSEDALTETQRVYQKYCSYIAFHILGNQEDADECVNDALHAAWNSIPPKKPENLKTYLGKLVREISVSRWRETHAAKRTPSEYLLSLEEIEEVGRDEDFTDTINAEILSQAISDFLRTLPEDKRNLFIRRYWYNDSIRELCERFGYQESKVKVSLKRVRDKLSIYLKKRGYYHE